jgi:type IV pilus modification protein PilV
MKSRLFGPTHSQPFAQRGISLVEALVAFLVMAIGMLAIIGIQATLRFNSDAAKQRSEAVRLAQAEIERMRAFSVLPVTNGATSYTGIVPLAQHVIAGVTNANTQYNLTTILPATNTPAMQQVQVTVTWADRQGADQRVTLTTAIAGIDPALSGYLGLVANGQPLNDARGRSGGRLPFPVKDLGDGTSVYKPAASGNVAWIFNNLSGVVTSRCTVPIASTTQSLTVNDFVTCTTVTGFTVGGSVRFAQNRPGPLTAADAEFPDSPQMPTSMLVDPENGPNVFLGSECFTADPISATQSYLSYVCLVLTSGVLEPRQWSGRVTAIPISWSYGDTASTYKLCRYSADYDGLNGITNEEHPDIYSAVSINLTNQNFLVIRGSLTCPTDVAADPEQGDLVNSNTMQAEPRPAAT